MSLTQAILNFTLPVYSFLFCMMTPKTIEAYTHIRARQTDPVIRWLNSFVCDLLRYIHYLQIFIASFLALLLIQEQLIGSTGYFKFKLISLDT